MEEVGEEDDVEVFCDINVTLDCTESLVSGNTR